jgi:hypothetical protein
MLSFSTHASQAYVNSWSVVLDSFTYLGLRAKYRFQTETDF